MTIPNNILSHITHKIYPVFSQVQVHQSTHVVEQSGTNERYAVVPQRQDFQVLDVVKHP